jgi:hypothetical protein
MEGIPNFWGERYDFADLLRWRKIVSIVIVALTLLTYWSRIGIGGVVAHSPLPHHRTCGSAYGGSVRLS